MTAPQADPDSILARLVEIGRTIHEQTSTRDALAAERRDLYVQGEAAGLTHKRMAEAQGITEGAVTLALRKMQEQRTAAKG